MPAIDLRTIPTFVISADPHRERHIRSQLAPTGIDPRIVRGIHCDPGIIGCALSHLKVLSECPLPPCLVLEDDCSVTEHFQSALSIPGEASAVYLGISTWGRVANQARGVNHAVRVTRYNAQWLRVTNMLSTHAILYLRERYMVQTRKVILECLIADVPFDMGLAALERHHIVLTPNEPFFYQDASVGGCEGATKTILVSSS